MTNSYPSYSQAAIKAERLCPIELEVERLTRQALTVMQGYGNSYHNDNHVRTMLSGLKSLYGHTLRIKPRKLELVLAIAFHDVVYVPGAGAALGLSGVNEEMSALMLTRFAERSVLYHDRCLSWTSLQEGVKTVDVDFAANLIRATTIEHHKSDSTLSAEHGVLLDLDLLSLADDYDTFKLTQDRIASEFAGANEDAHELVLAAQAKFLEQTFLAKNHIYRTIEAQHLEAPARRNLERFCAEVPTP